MDNFPLITLLAIKKMNYSVTEKIEQINSFAFTLLKETKLMNQRRHIVEPLILSTEIKTELHQKMNNTYGANAYNHIIPLFIQDLVRDLSRLAFDTHDKTASLKNLHRKIKQEKVLKRIKENFVVFPNKFNNNDQFLNDLPAEAQEQFTEKFRQQHRERFEASFDDAWDQINNFVSSMEENTIVEKLKTYRDKYYSHIEMSPLGQAPKPFNLENLGLKYDEVLNYLDEFMKIVYDLVRILTGVVYSREDDNKMYQSNGTNMWRLLLNKEEIKGG